MSTTMKSAVHHGREYQQNLIACRKTNFEEIKTLFDITLRKADRGKVSRNSEFIYYEKRFLSLYEIDSVSCSSNHVGESKSACLLRFSLVCGKDEKSFRSE